MKFGIAVCLSVLFIQGTEGITIKCTCDNKMNFYVDGVKQNTSHSTDWTKVDTINLEANKTYSMFGVHCINSGGPAGIIASVSDNRTTNIKNWKCTNQVPSGLAWTTDNFDDSSWPRAISFGTVGISPWSVVTDITSHAQWIWTAGGDKDNPTDLVVYCRFHIKHDGNWSVWGQWQQCPSTVGSHTQNRTRTCTNPEPDLDYGGENCSGDSSESRTCINGGWTDWSQWLACPSAAGSHTQTITRTCTNPEPNSHGSNCSGLSSDTRTCTNGNWSAYGAWSTCSLTCDNGTQTQTRTCSNPSPAHNGADCVGSNSTNKECFITYCPVNGNWGNWINTTCDCSSDVFTGTQSEYRLCNNPAPQHNGNNCTGQATSSTTFSCDCLAGVATNKYYNPKVVDKTCSQDYLKISSENIGSCMLSCLEESKCTGIVYVQSDTQPCRMFETCTQVPDGNSVYLEVDEEEAKLGGYGAQDQQESEEAAGSTEAQGGLPITMIAAIAGGVGALAVATTCIVVIAKRRRKDKKDEERPKTSSREEQDLEVQDVEKDEAAPNDFNESTW